MNLQTLNLQTVISGTRNLAIEKLKQRLIGKLVARLPFLGWGFISPITNIIVDVVMEEVIERLEVELFLLITTMKVERRVASYTIELNRLTELSKVGNDDEIKLQLEKLRSAASTLVRFDATK